MCSTQWEAPVIPGRSFFEPTRYQTQTLAVGLPSIGASNTESPFPKRNRSTRGPRPTLAPRIQSLGERGD